MFRGMNPDSQRKIHPSLELNGCQCEIRQNYCLMNQMQLKRIREKKLAFEIGVHVFAVFFSRITSSSAITYLALFIQQLSGQDWELRT